MAIFDVRKSESKDRSLIIKKDNFKRSTETELEENGLRR